MVKNDLVMKKFQSNLVLVFLLFSSIAFAQLEYNEAILIEDNSCEIKFQPSTTIADLESFAKCFVYKSPEVVAQTTLQTNQIDFKNLPLLLTNQEFPTLQNTNRTPFLVFGEYDDFYANARTNNLAFFEANRNAVMSAGNVNFPGVPIF
jgi:hypothetical protein